MDTQRFARIEALFHQAMARPADQRSQWLKVIESDPTLVADVERLIACSDGTTNDLQDVFDKAICASSQVAASVGPYHIVRELGAGGMGAVFLAERLLGDTRQRVALKLIRGLPTSASRERLARERTLLAELNHPHIARLVDAGEAADGTPYLAMEYVEGMPLHVWCEGGARDLAERLRLFVPICRAVQHAHRQLIVHRDIKPANILVRDGGAAVLLDFGIGRLLTTGQGDRTSTQVFTPAYAAPEQVAGGRVTTAIDIYGLGCVLFELVSGRAISEFPTGVATLRPSFAARDRKLAQALRGDIDTIVGKAMYPDPAMRYGSAAELADDVERFIAGHPVRAHAPSRRYRLRKFLARHRSVVAIVTVSILSLCFTLAMAVWQARRASVEAQRAGAVRDFLVSVFESAGGNLPQDMRPSTQDIVDQAAAQLTTRVDLSDALRVDFSLTLAEVARSVGAYDQALGLLDRAKPVLDRLYGQNDLLWWRERVLRARLLESKHQDANAVVALLQPLRADLLARRDAIGIEGLETLATALIGSGHEQDGIDLLHRVRQQVQMRTELAGVFLLDISIREARALLNAHRFAEGLKSAEAALDSWRKLGEPPKQTIIDLYGAIALGAEAAGDIPRAEMAYRDAIAAGDRFFDKPNPATAWNTGMYGTFLVAQGRFGEAEPYLRRGLEMRRQVFGADDQRSLYAIAGMGKLYLGQGKFAEAVTWFGQGVDSCRRTGLQDNVCPRLYGFRARAYVGAKQFAEAERDIDTALVLQGKLAGENSPNYAAVLFYRVSLQVQEGRYAEAIDSADRVLAIDRAAGGGMIQADLSTRYWRTKALYALGRDNEALEEILDVEPRFAAAFPQGAERVGIEILKAQLLARAHRSDDAREAARLALQLDPARNAMSSDQALELERLARD